MKENKLPNYLAEALSAAWNSHDDETKVGAILIHKPTGIPLITGSNQFVRGALDHILPKTRPEKYKHIIHAEIKLLSKCLRTGTSVENCAVLVTLSPCIDCTTALWEAGIDTIYFPEGETHPSYKETLKGGDLRVEESLVNGFLKLTLSARRRTDD